jgi:chromosome segregation ATPase
LFGFRSQIEDAPIWATFTVTVYAMEEDPVGKCLEIAERIIGCLNEGEILRRYLSVKKKIDESRPTSLSQHLKRLALEKRELTSQLSSLQKAQSDATSLTCYVLSQLESIHKNVSARLPEARFSRESLESAFTSLLDVIDAKSKSNDLIRQRITNENAALRDKISSLAASTNDELKLARERMRDFDHKSRKKHRRIDQKLMSLRSRLERQETALENVEEENREIVAVMSEKETIARDLMKKLSDLEQHASLAEYRLNDLKRQSDRLRSEDEAKEREIGTQRAAQRFGVADISDRELLELRTLEGDVARLIQENELIGLELKKRRLLSGNAEITEMSSISGI